jgi:organic radical activating enzyme
MIRYIRRTYPFLSKSNNIQSSSKSLYKSDLHKDRAVIDKIIEENGGIYDKIKETNNSLDKNMIKMLQRENAELQRENEILNEERNDLLNKNNELREFLKQRLN